MSDQRPAWPERVSLLAMLLDALQGYILAKGLSDLK